MNYCLEGVGIFISSKDSFLDLGAGIVMEIFKGDGRHCASDSRGKGFACISHEILHGEEFSSLDSVLSVNIEMPVVAESESQFGVIGCLNDDLIGHEVRPK